MIKLVTLSVLIFCSSAMAAMPEEPHPLVGTWKKVATRDSKDGAWVPMPEKYSMLKHITPTHVSWAVFRNDTKEVVMAMGGRVTIDGKSYTETVDYGLGSIMNLLNTRQKFTWKIEGGRFYQAGTLTNGTYLEDQYERVVSEEGDKKDSAK